MVRPRARLALWALLVVMGCPLWSPAVADAREPRSIYDLGVLTTDLMSASRIAVAPVTGDLYVLEGATPRVRRYSARGVLLGVWGSQGDAPGQFDAPTDLTVGLDGAVYVADYGNRRIEKFAADGALIDARWSGEDAYSLSAAPDGTIVVIGSVSLTRYGPDGTVLARRPVPVPNDVTAGRDGRIFIASAGGIGLYDAGGGGRGLIFEVRGDRGPFRLDVLTSRPGGTALTPDGDLLVPDPSGHRVLEITAGGVFQQACGAHRFGAGFVPLDVATAADGSIYVLDGQRIRRLSTAGGGPRCRDVQPRVTRLRVTRNRDGAIVVRVAANVPGPVDVRLTVRRTGGRIGSSCFSVGYPADAPPCRYERVVATRERLMVARGSERAVRFRPRRDAFRVETGVTDATGITSRRRRVRIPR